MQRQAVFFLHDSTSKNYQSEHQNYKNIVRIIKKIKIPFDIVSFPVYFVKVLLLQQEENLC